MPSTPSFAYLNGRIIESRSARLSLDDIGVLRGYGVFEVVRTFGKRPFRLDDHLTRFEDSASFLGLRVPESRPAIGRAIGELVARNAIEGEAHVRIVLTGGPSSDGFSYDPATPTFYILVSELKVFPAECYERGVGLVTMEHQRQLPRAKTLDYLKAVRLRPEVLRQGGFEILYVSGGRVLEGASSNVFLVRGGTVVTPEDDALLGITRAHVLHLLEAEGVPAERREVRIEELAEADEAFLTSTTKSVMPVARIDEKAIGEGRPGPTTRRIMELFERSVAPLRSSSAA